MFSGPYNSPPALGRFPATCALIVIGGMTLPFIVGFSIAQAVFPDLFVTVVDGERTLNEANAHLLTALILFGVFVGVSSWSEQIGAGAFAGSVRLERRWLLFAVIVSPIFWMVFTSIPTFITQSNDWVYASEQAAASMDMRTWSLSLFVYAILLAPMIEEILYRGIGFGCLAARGVPPVIAIAIPNIVFAVTHTQYSPLAMFVVFLGGFWFGFLRIKTGTILAPIAGHISINASLIYLGSIA